METVGRSRTVEKNERPKVKRRRPCRFWLHFQALLCLLGFAGCAPFIQEPSYAPPPPPPAAAPPAPAPVRPTFFVNASRLNLRACPGMDCPKIYSLERNEEVEQVGESEDWSQVRVKRDGTIGWVATRFLSVAPVAAEKAPTPLPPPLPPLPEVTRPAPPAPPPPAKPPAIPERPPLPERPKPVRPAETPAPKPTPKPAEAAEPSPAKPPVEKPAPPKKVPEERPAPAPEPPAEPPKKIRIM